MEKDDKEIVTGDAKSGYKKFPSKPSTWDSFKEAFEPTATRAVLESIRKRRDSSASR